MGNEQKDEKIKKTDIGERASGFTETFSNHSLSLFTMSFVVVVAAVLLALIYYQPAIFSSQNQDGRVNCDEFLQSLSFEFECPNGAYFTKIKEDTPYNYHPVALRRGGSNVKPETYDAFSLHFNGSSTGVTAGIIPRNYISFTRELWADKKTSLEIDGREATKYSIDHNQKNVDAYIAPITATTTLVLQYDHTVANNKKFSKNKISSILGSLKLPEANYTEGDWKTYKIEEFGFRFKYPEAASIGTQWDDRPKRFRISIEPIDRRVVSVVVYPADSNYLRDLKESPGEASFYSKLTELRNDFDEYTPKTSRTDDYDPTGPAASYRYHDKKIKIDGIPALDRIFSGGGDSSGRSVSLLHEGRLIKINHSLDYFERIEDACGPGCSKAVTPYERIDSDTTFDRLLKTISF